MTYIIAEIGVNHNGDIELARELIEGAVKVGADAVKTQSFITHDLVTVSARKAPYQISKDLKSRTQFEMLERLQLSFEQQIELCNYAKSLGIDFLSTPFEMKSLDFLVNVLKLETIKIASSDIVSFPLLYCLGQSDCKIILSTGMATETEIEFALGLIVLASSNVPLADVTLTKCANAWRGQDAMTKLHGRVTLLHCISEYPARVEVTNLNYMNRLRDRYGLSVGFSDHSMGVHLAVAAVSLGAEVIEKHLTIDRSLDGPDHAASLDLEDFSRMVREVRDVELALGDGMRIRTFEEEQNLFAGRKSLVALQQINIGETFTQSNLGMKRPGTGISALEFGEYLGKTSSRHYQRDELIEIQ